MLGWARELEFRAADHLTDIALMNSVCAAFLHCVFSNVGIWLILLSWILPFRVTARKCFHNSLSCEKRWSRKTEKWIKLVKLNRKSWLAIRSHFGKHSLQKINDVTDLPKRTWTRTREQEETRRIFTDLKARSQVWLITSGIAMFLTYFSSLWHCQSMFDPCLKMSNFLLIHSSITQRRLGTWVRSVKWCGCICFTFFQLHWRSVVVTVMALWCGVWCVVVWCGVLCCGLSVVFGVWCVLWCGVGWVKTEKVGGGAVGSKQSGTWSVTSGHL